MDELLPALRPLVEEMVDQRRRLTSALERRERLQAVVGGNGGSLPPRSFAEVGSEVEAAAATVGRCVQAIHDLGGQVKDPERGLVDFPALRGDEQVLLCWQLGEDRVAFWHTLEAGFAGRQTLPFE